MKSAHNNVKGYAYSEFLHSALLISWFSMSDCMFKYSLVFVIYAMRDLRGHLLRVLDTVKQTTAHSQTISSTRILFSLTHYSFSLLSRFVWKSRLTFQELSRTTQVKQVHCTMGDTGDWINFLLLDKRLCHSGESYHYRRCPWRANYLGIMSFICRYRCVQLTTL